MLEKVQKNYSLNEDLGTAAVVSAGSFLGAVALQQLYKKYNFYPPSIVFWGFSGIMGYIAYRSAKAVI